MSQQFFKNFNSTYEYSTKQKLEILTNECRKEKVESSLIGEEFSNIDLGDLA